MKDLRGIRNAGNDPKRGYVFQVQVRRAGHKLARTFVHKKEATAARMAQQWRDDVEAAIRMDSPKTPFRPDQWLPKRAAERTRMALRHIGDASPVPTLSWSIPRALDAYWEEVGQHKASPDQERSRTKRLKAAFQGETLGSLSRKAVQKFVNERNKVVAPATVRLEVMHLRVLIKHARGPEGHGWELEFEGAHPCDGLHMKELPPERDRRLEDADPDMGTKGEEEAIRTALAEGLDGPEMVDLFDLALATGMRRSEMLGLTASEVRTVGRRWEIKKKKHKTSKRGHKRQIVLTPDAIKIVRRRKRLAGEDGRLFTLSAQDAKTRFRKACKVAAVVGFRFHDIRHEALSRMSEVLTFGELKKQSGHSSAASLLRYLDGRAKDIAGKLGA